MAGNVPKVPYANEFRAIVHFPEEDPACNTSAQVIHAAAGVPGALRSGCFGGDGLPCKKTNPTFP